MMQSLIMRFAALTRRERFLVAIAVGLTALIVMVYGIIVPLGRAYDAAELRHRTSVERSSRIVAALGVTIPSSRIEPGQLEDLVRSVQESAAELSSLLNYTPAARSPASVVALRP